MKDRTAPAADLGSHGRFPIADTFLGTKDSLRSDDSVRKSRLRRSCELAEIEHSILRSPAAHVLDAIASRSLPAYALFLGAIAAAVALRGL